MAPTVNNKPFHITKVGGSSVKTSLPTSKASTSSSSASKPSRPTNDKERQERLRKKFSPEYLAAVQAALKKQGKAMSLPADKPKTKPVLRGTESGGVSKPRSKPTNRPDNRRQVAAATSGHRLPTSHPNKEVEVTYQLFTGQRCPSTREMIWYYPKRGRWTPSSKDYRKGNFWYAETADGLARYQILPGQSQAMKDDVWDGVRQGLMKQLRTKKLIG